jgi:uncharacterized glyoxalase superfamily protein PhnB
VGYSSESASNYFERSGSPFMLNCIVHDLDAILAKLASHGVRIDPQGEDYDYGRFAGSTTRTAIKSSSASRGGRRTRSRV